MLLSAAIAKGSQQPQESVQPVSNLEKPHPAVSKRSFLILHFEEGSKGEDGKQVMEALNIRASANVLNFSYSNINNRFALKTTSCLTLSHFHILIVFA